jgi:hypothetical protein
MFTPRITSPRSSLTSARARLTALRSERLDATEYGLEGNALYMDCLDAEIAAAEQVYATLAVADIARLRADLNGALAG